MNNLFLAGIKHCGKTTTAEHLAPVYRLPCLDSDSLVEQLTGTKVRTLYREKGKEFFMQQELLAMQESLATCPKAVYSLGGGACDNAPLISLVRKSGIMVYMKVSEKVLLKRILSDGIPPFLDPLDVTSSFHRLYIQRDRLYGKQASFVIRLEDDLDISSVCKKMKGAIDEFKQLR